jgi:hypothetical protein
MLKEGATEIEEGEEEEEEEEGGIRKYLDVLEVVTPAEVNMRHNECRSSENSVTFEMQQKAKLL